MAMTELEKLKLESVLYKIFSQLSTSELQALAQNVEVTE